MNTLKITSKSAGGGRHLIGFTLVELIIVITILAILATIAFVSFQNYTKDSRDANRIMTVKNIETWLDLFSIKSSTYPSPDVPATYTGGITQWIIWENVSNIIQMNNIPLDPKDGTNYVYSTYQNGRSYQIWIESENQKTSFLPQTYAASKSVIVKWNYKFSPSLPSLILVENEALTQSGIFSPEACFVMDGWKNTLKNCVEKKNEMILKNYDNSLIWYFDMETIASSDGSWNYLKNLSGDVGNCQAQITATSLGDGVNGKAISSLGMALIPMRCEGILGIEKKKFSITFKYKVHAYPSWLFSLWINWFASANRTPRHWVSGWQHSFGWWLTIWSIELEKWYLYTLVYDEWNYKVYHDTDIIYEWNMDNESFKIILFWWIPWNLPWLSIDELLIYDRILSTEEIARNVRNSGF